MLPIAIRTAEPWLKELAKRVKSELADRPMLLVFGRKDPLLGGAATSDRWLQTFPDATLVELAEETADAIIAKFAV